MLGSIISPDIAEQVIAAVLVMLRLLNKTMTFGVIWSKQIGEGCNRLNMREI